MHLKLLQKEQFKERAEPTGNLIGNKIFHKITKSSLQNNLVTDSQTEEKLIEIPKRYTYLQNKDRKLLVNYDKYDDLIMGYQKKIHLLDNTPN